MPRQRTAPMFLVKVGKPGQAATERVDESGRIKSLSYEDDEAKADKLTLSVDNYDLANFDAPIWVKGNVVEVSWGYPGEMTPARDCVIQEVKGSTVLSVVAQGKEVLMNREHKCRIFENLKHSDVAKKIAEENGFGAEHQDIEDTEVVLEQVTQARMTDWQLIRDMARKHGYECYVDFDGFHFHRRKLKQKPLRKYVYFVDPEQGDIITWNVDNDISPGKPGGITLKGRDPLTKATFEVRSDNQTEKGRTSLAPVIEVVDKVSLQTSEKPLASTAQEFVAGTSEHTQASAKRQATGIFLKQQLTAVEITASCWGDPTQVAKSIVELGGIGATLSGNYYCKSVKHDIMPGYKMTMKVRRDGKTQAASLNSQAGEGTGAGGPGVTQAGQSGSGGGGSGGSKGVASQGAQNAGKAASGQSDKLEPVEKVDPITHKTTVVYKEKGGKSK